MMYKVKRLLASLEKTMLFPTWQHGVKMVGWSRMRRRLEEKAVTLRMKLAALER
jgi:hypothetical protein